jgi:CHAD domain-containing protein
LSKQQDDLIETVQWRGTPPEPTIAEASHERLLPLIRDFFTSAAADLSDPHQMHQMRIAGKRLRYALELFGGAYDASLREDLYPIFIEVQDHLGLVNDYVTSQTRLLEWSHKASGKLRRYMQELVEEEKIRYEAQVVEFHRWWNPQRVQDLHYRFIAILRQNGKLQDLKLVGE